MKRYNVGWLRADGAVGEWSKKMHTNYKDAMYELTSNKEYDARYGFVGYKYCIYEVISKIVYDESQPVVVANNEKEERIIML